MQEVFTRNKKTQKSTGLCKYEKKWNFTPNKTNIVPIIVKTSKRERSISRNTATT